MTTLPTDEIIPHAVARRLAPTFGLEALVSTGFIPDGARECVLHTGVPDACRDHHGFLADKRAMIDYVVTHGEGTQIQDWANLWRGGDAVVPWAYGRAR